MRKLALLLSLSALSQAQVITSVAGTDWVFPASSIAPLSAPIGRIQSLAADPAGNIYIADSDNCLIYRYSPSGALTVVAGNGVPGFSGDGGPATAASLAFPFAVAVDSSGNLYIADTGNARIRKVAAGVISTIAGNGAVGYSGDGFSATTASLNNPSGIAVDTAGNVYVADTNNNRIRKIAPSGVISTFAGNGFAGFTGDGSLASVASFNAPWGVATDSQNNVYIADSMNHRIRRVDTKGIVITLAGNGALGFSGDNGPATSAALSDPSAVALDSAGNIYIADIYNSAIRKVSAANGFIATISNGNGHTATPALFYPFGVTVDPAGNVYVSNTQAQQLVEITPPGGMAIVAGNGNYRYSGDGGQATLATLNFPTSVAVSSNGTLYFPDEQGHRVRSVSPKGVITTVAGNGAPCCGPLYYPNGVALDAAGNLYIADTSDQVIRKISAATGMATTVAGNGTGGFSGDNGGATAASLFNPIHLTFDATGNMYIADQLNNRVRMVSPSGTITTVAGKGPTGYAAGGFSGDGGPATSASLNAPSGVAVDSAGNLYIADTLNNRIRRVDSKGVITTFAGTGVAGSSGDNGPAANAQLNNPLDIALDADNNLFIADTSNQRIRVVTAAGIIKTVAGSGIAGFTGDGGLGVAAELNNPNGVAIGPGGTLFIADSSNNRIREVLPSLPFFTAAPTSGLSFTTTAGVVPPPQSATLSSTVPNVAYTASTSAPWIALSQSGGTMPAVIQVTVDPTTLSPGSYNGLVTILAPNAFPPVGSVGISFTVTAAAAAPKLSVSTQPITFTATPGAAALTQTLQVLNTGGGSLPFTATLTSGGGSSGQSSWLALSSQSGTATPSAPAALTVSATPGTLSPGVYTGSIVITGAGTAVTVPVTFTISNPTGTLTISQAGLTFTAVAQGGAPLPQSFGILNTGQGSVNWTASATTLSGGAWLQLSSTNGAIQRPFLDVSTVNVTVNPAGLSAGTYYGRIQIASTGAVNSPQSITVMVNVLPPGTNPGPQVYPNGLIFTGLAGANPSSQDISIANTAGGVNSYVSGVIGPVSFLPGSGAISAKTPTPLHVYPNFSSLAAGITRGTITLQFADGSPSQAINVLMSVAPAPSAAADSRLSPRAASCPPGALNVVYRAPQPALPFSVATGQAIALEVAISDSCGNPIVPGAGSPHVFVAFTNGDPLQYMTHIGNGVWQASWRPVSAGPVTAVVDATILAGTTVVGGQASISGAVTKPPAASAAPLVTAQGVVHAASDAGGIPISPGELITVYGANLASAQSAAAALPLPTSSNGTQVFLGAQALPILFTSSGQMNVQVPYSANVNTTLQLAVQNGSSLSVPETLTVAAASPGIFTINQQGFGQGVIVKSDGVTLAQPGTPAAIGETIVIYCTGLGATTPPVAEGQPAPSSTLAQTSAQPTVTIGGKSAQVLFSGLTPGFAGLYQINAVVPAGISTGDSVSVLVAIAGQTSQPNVTLSVH